MRSDIGRAPGGAQSACEFAGHIGELDRGNMIHTEHLCGFVPAVTRNDTIFFIDKNWIRPTESLYGFNNLTNLFY